MGATASPPDTPLAPTPATCNRQRRLLFGHVQACAGRLGTAALSPQRGREQLPRPLALRHSHTVIAAKGTIEKQGRTTLAREVLG